jgi:hypothetical protein
MDVPFLPSTTLTGGLSVGTWIDIAFFSVMFIILSIFLFTNYNINMLDVLHNFAIHLIDPKLKEAGTAGSVRGGGTSGESVKGDL